MSVSAHQAIVDALTRKYTAPPVERIKRPITHRQGLTARLAAIEAGTGGEQAAADAAGVTLRTWRGWKRNPLSRLAGKSRQGVEQAYRTDWERRNADPVRQMRYALAKARHEPEITITAEMQWDGYYNGQGFVGSERTEPRRDNPAAHRQVQFGPHDISPIVRAWKAGRDTREPMEALLGDSFGSQIFLNSYHRNVSVAKL